MIDPRQLYEVARECHGQRLQEADELRLARLVRSDRPIWAARVARTLATALVATGQALWARTQATSR